MKKILFLFALFLGMFLSADAAFAINKQPAPSNYPCLTAGVCTCVNSGPDWNPAFCRTCQAPNSAVPAVLQPPGGMKVCGGNPPGTKDSIACRRAKQVCNGQPVTCEPNPMTTTRATLTTGGESSGGVQACPITIIDHGAFDTDQ